MWRSRAQLAVLAAVFILPFLLAALAHWFGWAPGATANYGTLLDPRPVPQRVVAALDGRPARFADLRGKWVIVQFDAPGCDAYCERKLYFMRQIRKALGADAQRMERVWFLNAPGDPAQRLLEAIAGTAVWRDNGEMSPFFGSGDRATDHLYLVDPLGRLMMRYPFEPDPSRILKDVQRLMKYSGAG